MSKQAVDHNDAPPAYDSIDDAPSQPAPLPPKDDGFDDLQDDAPSTMRELLERLAQLPGRIQRSRREHASHMAARDAAVVSLLVPHITDLIVDMGSAHSPPTLGELVLVPAAAVADAWKLSSDVGDDYDAFTTIKRRVHVPPPHPKESAGGGASGELSEKERLKRHYEAADAAAAAGGPSHRGGSERMEEESRGPRAEFDEWGRWGGDAAAGLASSPADRWNAGEWWWTDEESALRIARHLQPPAPPPAAPASPQPDALARAATQSSAEPGMKRKSILGMLFGQSSSSSSFSKKGKAPLSTPVSPVVAGGQRFAGPPAVPEAVMTVRPVQLTFRHENEFGIWDSRSGWGILVEIRASP